MRLLDRIAEVLVDELGRVLDEVRRVPPAPPPPPPPEPTVLHAVQMFGAELARGGTRASLEVHVDAKTFCRLAAECDAVTRYDIANGVARPRQPYSMMIMTSCGTIDVRLRGEK